MLRALVPGGTFLLNTPYSTGRNLVASCRRRCSKRLLAKKAKFYVIDATKVARDSGMGGRINTIMQVCFFALSGVLPQGRGDRRHQEFHQENLRQKGRGSRADEPAGRGQHAGALARGAGAGPQTERQPARLLPPVSPDAPDFVRNVLGKIAAGDGDELPVSAFPSDGTFPTGTAQYEKRNLALEIPVWDEKICIQCLKCVAICPHATIRAKVYEPAELDRRAGDVQEPPTRACRNSRA